MKKGARSHRQRKQNFTRKKKKEEINSQNGITKLGFWLRAREKRELQYDLIRRKRRREEKVGS
jgi:hypothetical protein